MRKLTTVNDNVATSKAIGVAQCAPILGKSGHNYKTNSEAGIERPLLLGHPAALKVDQAKRSRRHPYPCRTDYRHFGARLALCMSSDAVANGPNN